MAQVQAHNVVLGPLVDVYIVLLQEPAAACMSPSEVSFDLSQSTVFLRLLPL